MILRTGVIALLFTLCLCGCSATEPVVWKAQNVSFTEFKAFEIKPVFNATGKTIDKGTLSLFTAYLKEQFKLQNLQLIDTPQTKSGVMIVQTELLVFIFRKKASSATMAGPQNRMAKCILRTRLVDKSTTHIVAKIVTASETGGRISSGVDSGKWTLQETVAAVAEEVAKLMQPEPKPVDNVWQEL